LLVVLALELVMFLALTTPPAGSEKAARSDAGETRQAGGTPVDLVSATAPSRPRVSRTDPVRTEDAPDRDAAGIDERLFEAVLLLEGIRVAELAYRAEFGTFTSCPPTPPLVPAGDTAPFDGPGRRAFEILGWTTDRPVSCSYAVLANRHEFAATAECDADGDGDHAVFVVGPDIPAERVTPRGVY